MSRPAPEPGPLADALRPALLKISRRMRRESGRAGLSPLDALLLAAIASEAGPGVSELADREGVSRPSMSARVKRLVELGLVSRDPGPETDRRRIRLAPTAAGRAALERVRRSRTDWLAARIGTLSETDRAALALAADALARLAERAS